MVVGSGGLEFFMVPGNGVDTEEAWDLEKVELGAAVS